MGIDSRNRIRAWNYRYWWRSFERGLGGASGSPFNRQNSRSAHLLFVYYDNVDRLVDSAVLASALTTGIVHGRILGVTRDVNVPNTATWLMSDVHSILGV